MISEITKVFVNGRICDSIMKREAVFKESGDKGKSIVEDILKSKFRSKKSNETVL